MSRAKPDSDMHLTEVLEAAKAKLNALNSEIQFAKEDNETYKKMVEDAEGEKQAMEARTGGLKEELKNVQDHNKDLATEGVELKSQINQAKQELAMIIEDGEQKYKDLTNQIKKAQEEQKKIQLQYKELQKDGDKLDKDRDKLARLQESLARKQEEIDTYKRELDEHEAKDNNRIQSLEEHAKVMKDLSSSP